jgi:UPF0755 protein
MVKKLIIFITLLVFIALTGVYLAIKLAGQPKVAMQDIKAPSVSITLLEGWNKEQIAAYLQGKGITTSDKFLDAEKNFNSADFPILNDKPKASDLEGFLFPDTYFIPEKPLNNQDINDIIIRKSLDNFSQKITPQMQAQASLDNMSLYQIITLASIIEKETGADNTEKKIVSGIFYNRLKAGVPLESDATVSYFTKHSPISVDDTKINNPYNTYYYKGLPMGPICNPSLNSIMAALYPTKTDYMFFLTDPKTGQAVYAVTYEQHLKNKQKYLK